MVVTRTIYDKAASFSFISHYRGHKATFHIVPANDRFAVVMDGRLVGHIKIGYDRHTWYVSESNYVEFELVREIGQVILEKYY
jgi:hypothetical protein